MFGKIYISKYIYEIDDDVNYVKTSKDSKNIKNNMIITPPKYINIKEEMKKNNKKIKDLSLEYKKLRTNIIDGSTNLDTKFNKVRDELIELNENNLLLSNLSKLNDESEIQKITEENFKLKNSQYNLMLNIKALLKTSNNDNVRELILENIKNNEEIFKNY